MTMFEWIDTAPTVEVQESEYQRLLGFPEDYPLPDRARELAAGARAWYTRFGRPWIYACQTADFDYEGDVLRIHGRGFRSKLLARQFQAAEVSHGVLLVVSAGPECEAWASQLWAEEKPDEYFFLTMFGSAVVERLVTSAGAKLCAWAEEQGMAVLPHYSPGYTGWETADQVPLFEILSELAAGRFPREIAVRESGMLVPKKSLLGLFGVTRRVDELRKFTGRIACESCAFNPCGYRRAPYAGRVPLLEDIRRLQPAGSSASGRRAALDCNAAYVTNQKALRKWSGERLQLSIGEGGGIEARFRYDGATCSNMGRPLAFEYWVTLGPESDRYPILSADCTPVSGDTGYQFMCAYLKDAEGLMRAIGSSMPLLGRPLNDVLTWQRVSARSGCYCEANARIHKWGLVLEVLHFALTHSQPHPITSRGSAVPEVSKQPTLTTQQP